MALFCIRNGYLLPHVLLNAKSYSGEYLQANNVQMVCLGENTPQLIKISFILLPLTPLALLEHSRYMKD